MLCAVVFDKPLSPFVFSHFLAYLCKYREKIFMDCVIKNGKDHKTFITAYRSV